MRDALFRAAQAGSYFPMEEPVAQRQGLALTEEVFSASLYRVPLGEVAQAPAKAQTVVWPYPKGTGDCIDRANCADDFLRGSPGFRVVTEVGLPEQESLAGTEDDLLLFAPFETIIPELRVDDEHYLTFRGRRIDAMMNELSLGYLSRIGLVKLDVEAARIGVSPELSTHFVNGTVLGLSKNLQMGHFTALKAELETLGVRPLNHATVFDDEQFFAAAADLLSQDQTVVVRPFSASQGTAVAFLNPGGSSGQREQEISSTLATIRNQMLRKYGATACFPLTLSPFEASAKIDGCVTDLRMFVVYDPVSGGLRSLPAMVRRAQVPLDARERLEPANAATNLNIPPAADAIPGSRVFALANEAILDQLGIDSSRLLELGKAATLLWGRALEAELAATGQPRQFSYGSADFIIAKSDLRGVPIEMNGNNVGSHPAVHPRFLERFGASTTFALQNLGIGG